MRVLIRITDGGAGHEARKPAAPGRAVLSRSRARKAGTGQGTGLGLAIVKHIVNRHRGGLTVESAPGLGT